MGIKIGYVPEHFSTPLHFAEAHGFFASRSLSVTLIPFPSGTGHMVKSLSSGEISIAIGLTEGWISAIANGNSDFKIAGKYVATPLCWAISTGTQQGIDDVEKLAGGKLGVSRIGSGSYVMGFVLAQAHGWLREGKEPFEFVILDDFKGLRDGVNSGKADAFMWEHYTSKKYYDSNEVKKLGEIYTPWPSWHIVASNSLPTATVSLFLEAVNEGIAYFSDHEDEAVEYISAHLDYSKEDAREWLGTVKFASDVREVDENDLNKTLDVLREAGVVKDSKVSCQDVVLNL
ncbi:unnamed protein product [Tuber melanosporum]|uniref:(Perigord truffle) hypothetical protein n=1 Tax=Tuber melanosporum (strain Mel28) TaxID=656061 RepID=D5G9K6_TUBMM|nr:uncharacterized protein GSTUM_00003364001 [Tuber melanosporum]CAZ81199.1 unnamed protein product [Tuber melanosporum]